MPIHPIAVEQGTTFSIREDGRTVGSGMLLKSKLNLDLVPINNYIDRAVENPVKTAFIV